MRTPSIGPVSSHSDGLHTVIEQRLDLPPEEVVDSDHRVGFVRDGQLEDSLGIERVRVVL